MVASVIPASAAATSARGSLTTSICSSSSCSALAGESPVAAKIQARSLRMPGAGVDELQLAPVLGRQPNLLGQLALAAGERVLAPLQRPGRDLQQPVLLNRLARLAHQVDDLVVVGEDRDRARVLDHLALDLGPVLAPVALDRDVDGVPFVDLFRTEQLHPPQANPCPTRS